MMMEGYAKRYSPASVFSLPTLYEAAGSHDRFTANLEELISQTLAEGGEVFVSGEAVNPDAKTLATWRTSVAAAGPVWKKYEQHWTE